MRLGLMLPGASSIPAADSAHPRMATAAGRRIVEMVWEDLRPRDILTTEAFENAVTAAMALGGSTNAIIHLIAMAGRAGAALDLDRFDQLSRRTPFLANIRPSGKFLMEDFYYAGGLRGLLRRLGDLLHTRVPDRERPHARRERRRRGGLERRGDPAAGDAARAGRRARGAARQPRAGRRGHQAHRRRSRGCCSTPARRSSSATTTTWTRGSTTRTCRSPPTPCWCCRTPGRSAGRACPSGACCRFPKKLLAQGVRDMVRVSDARMSGTSYGACVLHVAPESFVGGPLALVQDGDIIELDVPGAAPVAPGRRRGAGAPTRARRAPAPQYPRGFGMLYSQHVTQADRGCDFDFLEGTAPIADPEIH